MENVYNERITDQISPNFRTRKPTKLECMNQIIINLSAEFQVILRQGTTQILAVRSEFRQLIHQLAQAKKQKPDPEA